MKCEKVLARQYHSQQWSTAQFIILSWVWQGESKVTDIMAPSLQWLVNIGQQMDCECIGGIEWRQSDSQDYSMQVDSDSVEGICGLSIYLD